ncbi:MAG: membrane associated rhomboid family serine protease, partial [Myxococcota bacterium]
GAAMILAPREKIMLLSPFTLFIPITMTITTFGVVWLAMQLFGAIGGEGGIAFMAHLGGFAAGYLLTRRRSEPQREEPSGIRPGEAPSSRFRTVWVTDARGQTFAFHEPA